MFCRRLDGNQLREIPSGAFAKKDLYELYVCACMRACMYSMVFAYFLISDLRNNKFSEVPLIALQGARKVSKL